jgi:hypothetical protein
MPEQPGRCDAMRECIDDFDGNMDWAKFGTAQMRLIGKLSRPHVKITIILAVILNFEND